LQPAGQAAVGGLVTGRTRFPYQDSLGRLADGLGLGGQARIEFTAAAGRRIATPEAARAPGNPIVLRTPEPDAIEELALAQRARPVPDPGELGGDIWESDAELAAFLADLRASRPVPLG
jgi:hypothetical protein